MKILDLSNFNINGDIIDLTGMFGECENLESVNMKNLDLNGVSVTCQYILSGCNNLKYIYIFLFKTDELLTNCFSGISNFFSFCIKDDIENGFYNELSSMVNTIRDCSNTCYPENRISNNNKCIIISEAIESQLKSETIPNFLKSTN